MQNYKIQNRVKKVIHPHSLKHIKNRSYDTIPVQRCSTLHNHAEGRNKILSSQRSSTNETVITDVEHSRLPDVFLQHPTKVCLKPHVKC